MDSRILLITLAALASILGVAALLMWAVTRPRIRRQRRRAFIRDYVFPSDLRRRIGAHRPEYTFPQIDLVMDGLRVFFIACLESRAAHPFARPLGMPSKAVDEAWHEFILMTRDYSAFCQQAFGRYLHHTPDGRMRTSMDDALANTLHIARGLQVPSRLPSPSAQAAVGSPAPGLTAASALAAAPMLFLLDRQLGLTDGQYFDELHLARLEERRRAQYSGGDSGGDAGGGSAHASHGHCGDAGSASCGDGGGAAGASCSGGGGCGGGGGGCGGGGGS